MKPETNEPPHIQGQGGEVFHPTAPAPQSEGPTLSDQQLSANPLPVGGHERSFQSLDPTLLPQPSRSRSVGLYVIAGLSGLGGLLTLISGLVTDAPGAVVSIVAGFLSILLTLWLLTRSNVARIIFVIFFVLSFFSNGLRVMALINYQDQLNTKKNEYQQIITQYESKPTLTSSEKQRLAVVKKAVDEQKKVTAGALAYAYAVNIFAVVYSGFGAVYLMLPGVKEQFS